MSIFTALAAIAVVVLVVGKQVAGGALQGRRVLLPPAILTVVGIAEIAGSKSHPGVTDVMLLVLSAAIAIAVGLGLGAITRLERRDGHLWAQLPKRGLWLWGGLIVSRLAIDGIAHVTGAHVAAATGAILLTLGLNRAAQALVVVPRAIAAGIPFAPEKNGSVFGAGWFSAPASVGRRS